MKILEVKCMERTEAQKEYAVAAALRTAQGRNEIGQTMDKHVVLKSYYMQEHPGYLTE